MAIDPKLPGKVRRSWLLVPASDEDMLKISTDSKNLGFKGSICPHPLWISPVNTAFAPTES